MYRSGFETTLRAEKPNGRWVLLAPLVYTTKAGERIVVPVGFDTDFASVPRLPFMFWFFGDRAHAAAVIHDYLYRLRDRSRAEADAIFLEAMEASGIGFFSRMAMYYGVRAGGSWTWADAKKGHDERSVERIEAP